MSVAAVLAAASVTSLSLSVGAAFPIRSRARRSRTVRAASWRRLPVVRIVGQRADRARRRRIDEQVPHLLDLLAAASASGLSASQALERGADGVGDPMREALAAGLDRVRLGARWRDELLQVAERHGLEDLRRAIRVVTRAERLGTPLAAACAELAASVRAARRARSMERARTASIKMLFPLVFLVLPAFLLLTVVPVLVATLQRIR
jgi:tight adherence protein C